MLDGLELLIMRLDIGIQSPIQHIVRIFNDIVIDHLEAAPNIAKDSFEKYRWVFKTDIEDTKDGMLMHAEHRIDALASSRLNVGDHVCFKVLDRPTNVLVVSSVMFECLVDKVNIGEVIFRCLRQPPIYWQQCSWRIEHRGSFVTTQTMLDATLKMFSGRETSGGILRYLFDPYVKIGDTSLLATDRDGFNGGQLQALEAAIVHPLVCIWGPPGTGKTRTVVSILKNLTENDATQRILVTAPTHQAVDNVMRQFNKHSTTNQTRGIRVSTDVRKVSEDLRKFTCDAMVGKDINESPAARRKAQKQISEAQLVFTMCIGAGIGLLREVTFDIVVIDEASQQTEPASYVPIVKGCSRAILVGDHVQLRTTVQPYGQTLNFDVSLFERLWNDVECRNSAVKVMLSTQYRMHPALCQFPSTEFYGSNLLSAEHCHQIAIPTSSLEMPSDCRYVFVQVQAPEDLGLKSKSNVGQAKVCQKVLEMLCSPRESSSPPPREVISIAILTPYTRQVATLRQMCPSVIPKTTITISSIDSFQGQEADIVIYVTVRCNERGEIGFLKDLRRLNVVLTRAKACMVIIGDNVTLTKQIGSEISCEVWSRLIRQSVLWSWDETKQSLTREK